MFFYECKCYSNCWENACISSETLSISDTISHSHNVNVFVYCKLVVAEFIGYFECLQPSQQLVIILW